MRLPPIKGPTDMTLPDTVAADATFRLPVATRAAAAAGAPQMAALLDELLGLCGEEPITAVLAVTEALARRHPTQCVLVDTRALQSWQLATPGRACC